MRITRTASGMPRSAILVCLALVAPLAIAADTLSNVEVSFGRGLNTARPNNPPNHAVLPNRITVKTGGVVDFGIGNNFQRLILVAPIGNGPNGFGSIQLQMPPNSGGTTFHLQSMQLDLTNPNPPFETSNVLSCSIFV